VEPLPRARARPARELGAVPRALRGSHRATQGPGQARGAGARGAAVHLAADQGQGRAITRLRQIACHPRLADAGSTAPSSKLNAFLELVRELEDGGHRALVFSQFTSHLALVREALDQAKVAYLYLDGQTPEPERIRRVDAFQSGEAQLFLISLKAGGTGLNLTAADYVVHLDPWWNPAVEDQATDRAYRIGQDKPVTVYRLVAQGTIEEAILQLHEDKRDLVAGVLDGAAASAKLSTEELLALIRSGESAQDVDLGDDAVGDDEMPPADALGLDAGPRPSVQKSAAS
jgi:superfamily II DNA or RNA helicase